MSRAPFYSPCQCDLSDATCFECAVDLVIRELGWSPECSCIQQRREICGECHLHELFRWAFATADAPYQDLAIARLQSRGLIGRKDLFGIVGFTQDVELATRELLSESASDAVSHQALLHLFHFLTDKDHAIPRDLKVYVSEVVTGLRRAPELTGKYPKAQDTRDREIAQLISDVVRQTGLPATSNNPEEGKSACHAVARALTVLRLKPSSYETIRRVWRDRKALLEIEFPRNV